MSTPCIRCGAATDAYVCHPEAQALADELLTAAGHAEDAEAVITRQTRYGSGSRGGSDEPMPGDLAAAAKLGPIRNAAYTAARIVEDYTRRTMPAWRRAAGPLCETGGGCLHASCAALRVINPPSALAQELEWLSGQTEALRRHPAADELFADLHSTCTALARLVDRPPDRDLVGMCDCGKVLYATAGRTVIQCPERTCKLVWHVERSREILRRALDDKLFTAAEAARFAVRLDSGDRSTEQVRKLITKWHGRGLVAARGHVVVQLDELGEDGEPKTRHDPTFRFGDVVDRLAVTARRNREGAAA